MVRKHFAAALIFALLLTLPALGSAATLTPDRASSGTITDPATGLTWVADAQLVADTFPQAVELVQAMNSGRMENFGRQTWRVATPRELATSPFVSRSTLVADRAGGHGEVASGFRPVFGAATIAGVEDVVILAVNSALVERGAQITGAIVVNEASSGPTISPPFELHLDREVIVHGDVLADSIRIDKDVVIDAAKALECNDLTKHSNFSRTCAALGLPVFSVLPIFHTATPRPGAPDLTVPSFGAATLPVGDAGHVVVGQGGTLTIAPGRHDLKSLQAGQGSSILFSGRSDVRILGKLSVGQGSTVSGFDPTRVIFYVAGINGTDGALASSPKAVEVGKDSVFDANLYAQNGTILVNQDTTFAGSMTARDVLLRKANVVINNFFANLAPTAFPQDVSTNGAGAITITLSGSDPEGQDLEFAIVSGPTHGSLGVPSPIIPPPVTDPETNETAQPPVTQATVIYTPGSADDLADSFVFRVTDPGIASGTATVRINPPEFDEPTSEPTTVTADDVSDRTRKDAALAVTLSAKAPSGVALTYGLVAGSGPSNGTLGSLTPGTGSPPRTATIVYTPNGGFVGTDAFQFEVCGTVNSVLVCDVGDISIDVFEPAVEAGPLAIDQTLPGFAELPLTFALQGTPGGTTGGGASSVYGALSFATAADTVDIAAAMAGNVADSDDDGIGDNQNALPGGAPVFISASLSSSGGAGSNGVSRMNFEWPVGDFSTMAITSAIVTLNTNRGSIDSENTHLFTYETSGDGVLTLSDFSGGIGGASVGTMPVPDLVDQPIGADGTFSVDVTAQVQQALQTGLPYFWMHGRLQPEFPIPTTGTTRGLQVRSTAAGNLTSGLVPRLVLSSDQPLVVEFTLLSLPTNGTLRDSSGALITTVPLFLGRNAVLTYTAFAGFVGTDSITFEASDGLSVGTGLVAFPVRIGSCLDNVFFCDSGR